MGLFTLKFVNNNLTSGILEKTKSDDIDYENYFECWLENSPNFLLDEEESVIWIGRQVTAEVGDASLYPDLIGIDSSGDLIMVELKKGKTPREVIAQVLEYSAWGATLTYDDLNTLAQDYYGKYDDNFNKNLIDLFQEVFLPDEEEQPVVEFNKNQKLFIVAESISPVIKQVALHLRSNYSIDIYCIEYEVLKSKQGEYFISTEKIVGLKEVEKNKGISSLSRWNQPVKVKDVVKEAVYNITGKDNNIVFSPADVYNETIKQYSDINQNTVRCQIIQDCVNHTSRKHYPAGQQDLYYRVDKGKFRLYDPEKDGKWNFRGEKIS